MDFTVVLYDPRSRTAVKKYTLSDKKRKRGGDEFSSLDVLNNLDVTSLIREEDLKTQLNEAEALEATLATTRPGDEHVVLPVFPEDNLQDVRDKIYIATGIPFFRQHLFWRVGDRAQVPYELKVRGRDEPVDIDEYLTRGEGLVAGLPVDTDLAEEYARGNVTVTAMDQFTLVGDLHTVYVVDFAREIADSLAVLKEAILDPVQLDILYSGFIVKYWPQITPEVLVEYLETGRLSYPRLLPKLATKRAEVALAVEIAGQIHKTGAALYTHAVLSASLRVEGRQPVSPRHLFDVVALDSRVVAAVVRFMADSNAGERSVDITVVKRDQSAYERDDTAAIEKHLARAAQANSCRFVLRVFGDRQKGRAVLVVVNVQADGSYTAEGTWSENLGITTDNIRRKIAAVIAPLLKKVELAAPVATNSTLTNMTATMHWPYAMTTQAFKEMRSRLIDYEKAGFVRMQNLQKQGGLELRLLRGVVDYNPRAMEQIVLVSADGAEYESKITNTYTHLSNDQIAQRWNYIYSGRPMRVHHRTINIKIDIFGVSEEEFSVARLYMFGLLEGMRKSKTPGILRPQEVTIAAQARNTLKYLQDRDPELYDLRKHDASSTVYSVLCQNPRPPMMYNADEIQLLPAKIRDKLTPYWNYTTDEPAWYYCPNRKFPHISFLEGRHPLGYCLPCCQKTEAFPGSRREAINSACAAPSGEKPEPPDDIADSETSHVLSFGKRVPDGRFSHPPPLADSFLFGTLPSKHQYYLEGVPHTQTPGFQCIARILDTEPAALATELAQFVRRNRTSYTDLPPDALAADLLRHYTMPGSITAFSPGGSAYLDQKRILFELILAAHDLVLVEITGDDLQVFDRAIERIVSGDYRRLGFVVDLPVSKQTRGGVYPLVAVGPESVALRSFPPSHPAAIAVRRFLKPQVEARQMNLKACLRLFIGPKDPVTQLVNEAGNCYGLIARESVYLPVVESEPVSTHPIRFGPRPRISLPRTKLAAAIKNKVKPAISLLHDGKCVGFVSEDELYYYHDPSPTAWTDARITVPYEPLDVDTYITEHGLGMPERLRVASGEVLYEIYEHSLLTAKLSALVHAERNKPLRQLILTDTPAQLSPEDEAKVNEAKRRALRKKTSLASELARETFVFDQLTFNRLRKQPHVAVVAELKALLAPHVELTDTKPVDLPNIITGDGPVRVYKERYADLLSVLAGDILNPRKKESIISTSRVIDNLAFEPRPNEHIELLVAPWM